MKLIKKNSPNHYNGRNGWKADMIVFHQTGGTSVTPALNWYMNPAAQVSPNYVIDTNGDVYQLVDPDNAAWCNGTGTDSNKKLYYGKATSRLVRERKTNANYYTYSMEFVHCQYGNINDAQIAAAVELIKTVIVPHMKKNGVTPKIDRAHFIGHCEVDPVTRAFCPGKKFPYAKIIDCVLGKQKVPTAEKPQEKPATASLKVGDKVKVKPGACAYNGVKLASFVYGQTYDVMEIKGDRVVIGQKRKVTAAVRAGELVKV